MDNEELSNIYSEVESFWIDYNDINDEINKEKEYIRNYNYNNEKKFLNITAIISIIIKSIFKILLLGMVNYMIYELFNFDINNFIEKIVMLFVIVHEIKSNKIYLNNEKEKLNQYILDKIENIKELSEEKSKIKNIIYELTDKIHSLVNETLIEEDTSLVVLEELKEDLIVEPYLEFEDKVKILKREINKDRK